MGAFQFAQFMMLRSTCRLSLGVCSTGRTTPLWISLQSRALFVPPPVSCDVRVPSCAEPIMSKETFTRHYFDTYLPLFKELNQKLEGSEHQNERSLLKIMRNTIDSPGESDLFQVASNIHNHNQFFENLQNRLQVDYDQMSDYAKEQIQTNFTNLEQLKHEFLCHVDSMYGSGWVWLVDRQGVLEVVSTHDNYSPEATAESVTAILCLDLWEHAFWTDFGTEKEKYLDAFWQNVNWEVVDRRLHQAKENNEKAAKIEI